MLKHALPYSPDSAALFSCIAHLPWAVFLDSAQSPYGHYDILAAAPFMRLTVTDAGTEMATDGGSYTNQDDPFAVLKAAMQPYQAEKSDMAFAGGAIGYFAYDLARSIEHLPSIAQDAEAIPQMMVGLYDWAVLVDHKRQQTHLLSHAFKFKTQLEWPQLIAMFSELQAKSATPAPADFKLTSAVHSNMDAAYYAQAFDKVKKYILEGDCYQVNLAQRFSAQAEGDAWVAYQHLRQISPAPFMAYMQYPELQILSGSPERFLQVKNNHVETRPIKGTRPRAADASEDAANAQDLQTSLKDRAENLMIVDLLRNDISKNCAKGSVRADKLFTLESFANVHHLVSTVTGELAADKTAIDLLRGCFPGGSITGAPKLRSMQIIEELEPQRRGLYCGAIGYIGFDGNMDTNITIRTAVYANNEIRFWAGGGIVADSEMQKEYRETWDKASSMLQLMQYFGGKVSA
jgi:para-aminobenzoate synthetase component I